MTIIGITLWNNLATTETAADVCFCRMTPEVVQANISHNIHTY